MYYKNDLKVCSESHRELKLIKRIYTLGDSAKRIPIETTCLGHLFEKIRNNIIVYVTMLKKEQSVI